MTEAMCKRIQSKLNQVKAELGKSDIPSEYLGSALECVNTVSKRMELEVDEREKVPAPKDPTGYLRFRSGIV